MGYDFLLWCNKISFPNLFSLVFFNLQREEVLDQESDSAVWWGQVGRDTWRELVLKHGGSACLRCLDVSQLQLQCENLSPELQDTFRRSWNSRRPHVMISFVNIGSYYNISWIQTMQTMDLLQLAAPQFVSSFLFSKVRCNLIFESRKKICLE